LTRNLNSIDNLLSLNSASESLLTKKQREHLKVIKSILQQQEEMFKTGKHSIFNRIVNIHQPHVRPIVRGKVGSNVEFGAKIGVSLQKCYAKIDTLSWDAYNESTDLKKQVETYKKIHGYYPELVLADKIYLTRENRAFMKDKNIRFTGKPLGRPPKEEKSVQVKRKERQEAAQRNQIEGKFGQGKNKYGLNNIRAKLQKNIGILDCYYIPCDESG